MIHEGNWLRDRVTAATTITAFAAKAGVSREVLKKYFGMKEIDGRPDIVRAILQAVGVPDNRLREPQNDLPYTIGKLAAQALDALDVVRPDPLARRMVRGAIEYFAEGTDIDVNVEPFTENQIAEPIPLFELCVAAGTWVDVSDNQDGDGQRVTEAQLRQGLFRVRIRGDSMEPRFPSESVLEFRLLRTPEGTPDVEAMVHDQCYYVQLTDGTATFKQFDRADQDESVLVLRALNPKYKKKPLRASSEEVARLAAFEWVLSKGM